MTSYGFRVYGTPAPQGSKIPGVSSKTGKMFVREQSGKKLSTWREDVKQAALAARGVYLVPPEYKIEANDPHTPPGDRIDTLLGPVKLRIDFLMPRPASITVKKRPYPIVAPDLDKLVRGVGDALKAAGVYKDDAQICAIHTTKHYATESTDNTPGAWIVVSEINI